VPKPFRVEDRTLIAGANAIQGRAAEAAGAAQISFANEICPAGECRPIKGGELVWADGFHISPTTARRIEPQLAAEVERLVMEPDPR
jgi:hypothetical protein